MSSSKLVIDKLEKLFSELGVILEGNKKGDIDYQISEVRYVINILNECQNNNYIDFDDVINEIKLIY
ncbi:hypothetical protein CN947_29625, partial [Bacillus cereus]